MVYLIIILFCLLMGILFGNNDLNKDLLDAMFVLLLISLWLIIGSSTGINAVFVLLLINVSLMLVIVLLVYPNE